MARSILAIQASSANSEQVFSVGGLTVNNKRTRLGEERVEDLIVLAINIPLLKIFDRQEDVVSGSVVKRLKMDNANVTPARGPCCPDDDLSVLMQNEGEEACSDNEDMDKTF